MIKSLGKMCTQLAPELGAPRACGLMGQLRSARAGLLAVSAVALLSLLGLAALHGRHAAVAARASAGWAWHDAAWLR